jgi:peptidoglycan L-alanyl-D-glutamate endopeptidase CwlK
MDFVLSTVADISLIQGHRTKEQQKLVYDLGNSKVQWPNSKHNTTPSQAVDFQPYPYPNVGAHDARIRAVAKKKLWASLAYVAGAARVFAFANGWVLRWGGDWDGDGSLTDQNFNDLFHLEIDVEKSAPWTDPSKPGVVALSE